MHFPNSRWQRRQAGGRWRINLCEPKVQQLRVTATRHEDICGLHVTMNDTCPVSCVQRVGNTDRDLENLLHFERPSLQPVLQRIAVQPLHGDKWLALVLSN